MNGVTGSTGVAGPTGGIGPTGPGLTVFGNVFTPLAKDSETAVLLSGDVRFTNDGILEGITHTPGTAPITVLQSGTYRIRYSISISNNIDATITIAVNGVDVSSATVPTELMVGTLSNSIITNLTAGDVITLKVE